jgi:hypothetical protein
VQFCTREHQATEVVSISVKPKRLVWDVELQQNIQKGNHLAGLYQASTGFIDAS